MISFVGPATLVYAVCSLFAELMTGVTDVTMSAILAIDPAVRANSMENSWNPFACANLARQAGPARTVPRRQALCGAGTWRFTPATVRAALDAGWTAHDLLTELVAISTRPVPQPALRPARRYRPSQPAHRAPMKC